MGRNGLYPLKGIVGAGRSIVAGSFTTVNDANPTATKGSGFSVVRAAEGRWTVTLSDAAVEISSVVLSVAPETVGSFALVYEDQDARTTSVFEVRLATTADCSSTNFALADDPGSEISFIVICRDTSASDF